MIVEATPSGQQRAAVMSPVTNDWMNLDHWTFTSSILACVQVHWTVWERLHNHCTLPRRQRSVTFCVIRYIAPVLHSLIKATGWCHGALVWDSDASCSFFYADLKEHMSKWKHSIKYGFCLDSVPLQLPPRPPLPPPISEPESVAPCMNQCKWVFL